MVKLMSVLVVLMVASCATQKPPKWDVCSPWVATIRNGEVLGVSYFEDACWYPYQAEQKLRDRKQRAPIVSFD